MPFTYYASTDASAPTLNGQAGSLITVLDAILLNGYGAKAAAGWSSPWNDGAGNNKIYAPASAGAYPVKIQDNGPTAGGVRESYLAIGSAHLGAGALANESPANIGRANPYVIRKSETIATTARAWYAYADAETLMFFNNPGAAENTFRLTIAGRFIPFSATDLKPFWATGVITANDSSLTADQQPFGCLPSYSTLTFCGGSPTNADQSATAASLFTNAPRALATVAGATNISQYGPTNPDPYTGLTNFNDAGFYQNNALRGRARGVIIPTWGGAGSDLDTFTATLNGVARDYIVRTYGPAMRLCVEISDTLDL